MFLNDTIWSSVAAILLAAAGGLARQLNAKKPKKLKQILKELFVALFAGTMTLLLVMATNVTGYWIGIACGIGGWTSPNILHAITRMTEKILGTEKDELTGKNEQDH